MRFLMTVALLMLLMTTACMAQTDHLLFRASFDEALTAEVANGDPEPVWARGGTKIVEDGQQDSCAAVPDGGSLSYEAPGNVYWERGTLSFWWRCDDAVGQTEFTVASLGSFYHFYYGRWLRLYSLGGRLYMHIWDWHHDGTRLSVSSGEFLPQQGEWYHIAMGWDAAKGFALYINGEQIGSSDRAFYLPLNINQIGLGVSAVASHAKASSTRSQRFDEVRIFDRWLDDAQIAALSTGEDVRVGPALDQEAIATHRVESLGMHTGHGMPIAPDDGETLIVTEPQVVTAKDVLRTQMTGLDGNLASKWPSGMRYSTEGLRYDVEMAGEAVNYVAMTASHEGRVQLVEGDRGTVVAERTTDDPFITRELLEQPVAVDSAHVTRAISEEDRRHDGALIDLQMLHVATGPATEAGAQSSPLGLAALDQLGATGAEIHGEYPAADQTTLTPAAEAASVSLSPMQVLHLTSEAATERTGIGSVGLRFELATEAPTVRARLEMMHPLNYTRRQMILDFIPDGSEVSLELDSRDLVLEPGQRIHLALHFTEPVQLSAASISPREIPVQTAAEQYFPDQLRMMKMYFMRLSEARPWGWDASKIKLLGELYTCMYQLRELRPDDETVMAYYHWTHTGEPKPVMDLPAAPAGVPEWAWYQVKLLEMCKSVPQWWIDNRQIETGEFGSNDGPNDDSVLVQDFVGLHLMDGPDERLLESARKVGLLTWGLTMENGMNRQVTDPLHAYEWGANVNNMLAVMDYGNPLWYERMLEMGQHYDALTGINPQGHRHYRSNRYGLSQIVTEGRYGWDTTSNALNMQSAALLGWYSGHDDSQRYMTEWADAWMEDIVDPEDGRGRAYTVEFATGKKEPQRLLSYAFALIPWACYDQTRDDRYLRALSLVWESDRRHYDGPTRSIDVLQQLVTHTEREDIRANILEVISGIDLWSSPIRYTDTRPEYKYMEWLLTGDESAVTEALKATLSDLTWELPMYTTAEQSPDRLWLPQPILNHMMLGDISLLRNRIYPLHWVSWENTGGKLAAWVLEKDPKHLRVWLVNTGEEALNPFMRVWRLDHGQYEARLGADADGDGQIDADAATATATLGRGSRMQVPELAAKTVMVLEVTQTEALDPITERADIAIGQGDLEVDPQTGAATLTVHNIGARDAGAFAVQVTKQGAAPVTCEVASLPAPDGFTPSRVTLPLEGLQLAAGDIATVVLDEQETLVEITRDNNRVTMRAQLLGEGPPLLMHPVAD